MKGERYEIANRLFDHVRYRLPLRARDRVCSQRVEHHHTVVRGDDAAVEEPPFVVLRIHVVAGDDLPQSSRGRRPIGGRRLSGGRGGEREHDRDEHRKPGLHSRASIRTALG